MVIQVPYHKLKGRIQKDRERIGLNIMAMNNQKYIPRDMPMIDIDVRGWNEIDRNNDSEIMTLLS